MPQVFISYARQDVEFVDKKLIPLFELMKVDAWVDREDLHASDVWEKRIEEALVASDWYVLVMSERAAGSRNVRKEVEWIIRHRPSRLFPILFSDCRPNDIHDVLPTIHYIDYKQAPDRLGIRLLRSLVQGAWQAYSGERVKVEQLSAKIEEAAEERDELQNQVHELTGQLHDVSEFDGDWLGDGCGQAVDFVAREARSAPIISVLNLKGGVGKSTLAVNLGATFFLRETGPKRVLIVDLDFQTSASTLCLHSEERKDAMRSRLSTSRLLDDDDPSPRLLFECAKRIGRTPGFIVAGDDGLARQENKVLARWLTKEGRYDARFLLRRILHSPEVQAQFDLIILDCPPRLHVAAVNAVAASDFVLIPVLLDLTSADSVPRLLSWLVRFRREGLCPELELLGVVANKKSAFRKTLLNREHNVASKLAETSSQHWPFGPVPFAYQRRSRFGSRFRRGGNTGPFCLPGPKDWSRISKAVRGNRTSFIHAEGSTSIMMTVETLREQISSIRKLMLAAGASSTAQDNVDVLSATLAPFREMSIAEFAAFLAAAQDYRTTGKVSFVAPSKGGRARTPKAPKDDVAEAVPRYVSELESLYAVVHEETTGRGAIDDLVAEIGKLPVDAIKKIAEGFNLRISKPTKKKALDEIRRKLDQRKASAERSEPILKGWS